MDTLATAAKIEVVLKIKEVPAGARQVKNGRTEFALDADGQEVTVTVRPRMWQKLEQVAADWPQWVASITGKLGTRTPQSFVLEPVVQTFERKAKDASPPA